jgi:hypothetical protein
MFVALSLPRSRLFYQITLKKRKNLEQLIQIMQYKVQMLQQGGEK